MTSKIKTFTASNGKEVVKVETDSGVTGYVDCSVPLGAAKAFLVKLERALRKNQAEERKMERARPARLAPDVSDES